MQKGHNIAFISQITANTLQFSHTITDINILDINIWDMDSVAKNQRCLLALQKKFVKIIHLVISMVVHTPFLFPWTY